MTEPSAALALSPDPGSKDARALALALQDQVLKAWEFYIKFYTVFHAVNFVALGLVIEKVNDPWNRLFIALAFIAQNAVSGVTAVAMARYTERVADQQCELGFAQLVRYRKAGVWGGYGNAIGHAVIACLWFALIIAGFASDPHAGTADGTGHTTVTTTTTSTTTSPAPTPPLGEPEP